MSQELEIQRLEEEESDWQGDYPPLSYFWNPEAEESIMKMNHSKIPIPYIGDYPFLIKSENKRSPFFSKTFYSHLRGIGESINYISPNLPLDFDLSLALDPDLIENYSFFGAFQWIPVESFSLGRHYFYQNKSFLGGDWAFKREKWRFSFNDKWIIGHSSTSSDLQGSLNYIHNNINTAITIDYINDPFYLEFSPSIRLNFEKIDISFLLESLWLGSPQFTGNISLQKKTGSGYIAFSAGGQFKERPIYIITDWQDVYQKDSNPEKQELFLTLDCNFQASEVIYLLGVQWLYGPEFFLSNNRLMSREQFNNRIILTEEINFQNGRFYILGSQHFNLSSFDKSAYQLSGTIDLEKIQIEIESSYAYRSDLDVYNDDIWYNNFKIDWKISSNYSLGVSSLTEGTKWGNLSLNLSYIR